MRGATTMLRPLTLTTALALALAFTTVAAATGPVTVRATHQQLALKLTVQASGSTVTAKASLTNRGSAPYKYYGACVPPFLQIQATDAAGNHLYGWTPPQVTCMALSI